MKKILSAAFGALVIALMIFSAVSATENRVTANVTFPIPELGNCADQNDCRVYCDNIEHTGACLNFAEKNYLMSAEEVAKARVFTKLMQDKIAFPGDTKNPAQAQEYCENANHAEECLAFAEKHGLLDSTEMAEAKKFLPMLKAGETPGRCSSKRTCEEYCSDDANMEECLAFAEKHGLLSAQDAARAKQFKVSGGPGGCKGEAECETYCNMPEHQESCMAFAKENGIVKAEEAEDIKDGMSRLRTSLMSSAELRMCLTKNLSEETLTKIENGNFVPNSKTGAALKECFESLHDSLQQHAKDRLNEASPEVKACLQLEVGDNGLQALRAGGAPDPTVADKVRACFERDINREDPRDKPFDSTTIDPENPSATAGQGMPESLRKCVELKLGVTDLTSADKDGLAAAAESCANEARYARPENMDAEAAREQFEHEALQGMQESSFMIPPEVDACMKSTLGDDYKERLMSGALSQATVAEKVKSCMPAGTMPYEGYNSDYSEDR